MKYFKRKEPRFLKRRPLGLPQALLEELSGAKGEVRSLAARCEAAIQDLLERDALLAAQRVSQGVGHGGKYSHSR